EPRELDRDALAEARATARDDDDLAGKGLLGQRARPQLGGFGESHDSLTSSPDASRSTSPRRASRRLWPPSAGQSKAAGDQQPLHFGSSLSDGEDAGVAIVARHVALLDEAVATVQTRGLVGHSVGELRRHQLAGRRFALDGESAVVLPGRIVRHHPGRGGYGGDVRHREGDTLMDAEGLLEGGATADEVEGGVETGLCEPHGHGRDGEPGPGEEGQGLAVAAPLLAQQRLAGYPGLVEE